jgi:hypothetical protein
MRATSLMCVQWKIYFELLWSDTVLCSRPCIQRSCPTHPPLFLREGEIDVTPFSRASEIQSIVIRISNLK